jgi:hypothetical protein
MMGFAAVARRVSQRAEAGHRRRWWVWLGCWLACGTICGPAGADDGFDEGQALAAELRGAPPTESVEVRGLIRVRQPRLARRSYPFTYRVELVANDWCSIYETTGGPGVDPQRVTVVRRPDGPNRYRLEITPSGGTEAVGSWLEGDGAMIPFAGSDFWLADLGLDYLHWPEQRLMKELRIRMRKGRPCQILESRNPNPPPRGYSRVISWVDRETGKPILAEAYGADGRLLKEFEVGGVTKVDGVWELKNLEMRNVRDDSRTILEFNYRQSE